MIGRIGATPLPMAQSALPGGDTSISTPQPVSVSVGGQVPYVPRTAYSPAAARGYVPNTSTTYVQSLIPTAPIPTPAAEQYAQAPASVLPPVMYAPGEMIPLFPQAPKGPSQAEIRAAAVREERERAEKQQRRMLGGLLLAAIIGYALYRANKKRGSKS